ncbi:TPA: hypothetical protein EYP26_03660 [Candidatus Bathyarchaeota archaeon]|nr:hypothetical protein [Candidatus Bathyarchaeota archaeon]
MAWGWRGGWYGPWPGRGPFSYLPPWMRPGWWFGPGSCWWLFLFGWPGAASWLAPFAGWPYWSAPTTKQPREAGIPSYPAPLQYAPPSPEEEAAALERAKKALEEELKGVEARIEELRKKEGQ